MLTVERDIKIRGPLWDHLFDPYSREAWGEFPREQLFEGPAGTGKSMGIGIFLDMVARDWPGCRILVIRKTRVSLSQSWMVTFEEKVLSEKDPLRYGATRGHRQTYVYANGSEIVMGGMDNPTRTFSTEYDIIFVNEACEFSEDEVESLHRALRNGVLPFQVMILDCNPDSEFHWLNQRCDTGPTERRRTRLWHNPAYYTDEGWTEQGARYRSGLTSGLSGVRYQRLVAGEWATAEGTIIPLEKARHVIDAKVVEERWKRPRLEVAGWDYVPEVQFYYGTCDWGYRNPGTIQVWAVDQNRVAYLVREIYQTHRDEDWWAEQVVALDDEFLMWRVICDSASPEKIHKFNKVIREARDRKGLDRTAVALGAGKAQKSGMGWLEIQAGLMRRMFETAPNGMSRAYVLSTSLIGPDDAELKGKPKRFVEEAASWTFEKYDAARHRGKPKEVGDPDKPNHGIDAASYGFEWLWSHDLPDDIADRWGKREPHPDSWEALEPHLKWIK